MNTFLYSISSGIIKNIVNKIKNTNMNISELRSSGNVIATALEGTCQLWECAGKQYIVLADNSVMDREDDKIDPLFPLDEYPLPTPPRGEITSVMIYTSGETCAKIKLPDGSSFEITIPAEALKGICIEERFALIMKRAQHHLKCMSAE